MYYVCDIYDTKGRKNKYLEIKFSDLYKQSVYTFSGVPYCSMESLNRFMIGIYDSSDESIEYYTAGQIVEIIKKFNIDIKGVALNISITSYIYISVAIVNPSNDLLKDITRNKFLGIQYMNEAYELIKINKEFIDKDTLIIPEGIKYISNKILEEDNVDPSYFNCTRIKLPDSFDFKYKLVNLGRLANSSYKRVRDTSDNFIITNKDLIIDKKFFKNTCCSVISSGKIEFATNLDTLFYERGLSGIAYYSYINRDSLFYYIDKNSTKILDFKRKMIL